MNLFFWGKGTLMGVPLWKFQPFFEVCPNLWIPVCWWEDGWRYWRSWCLGVVIWIWMDYPSLNFPQDLVSLFLEGWNNKWGNTLELKQSFFRVWNSIQAQNIVIKDGHKSLKEWFKSSSKAYDKQDQPAMRSPDVKRRRWNMPHKIRVSFLPCR